MRHGKLIVYLGLFLSALTAHAGTLTVYGSGADIVLTGQNISYNRKATFGDGMANFTGVPSGKLLYLASDGIRGEGSSKISKFIFTEDNAVQVFGAAAEHDQFEMFNPRNNRFVELIFNPKAQNPIRLYVGEGPSSSAGSNRPTVMFNVNGQDYPDKIFRAQQSTKAYAACETFSYFQ